jgi:hypothetical protein
MVLEANISNLIAKMELSIMTTYLAITVMIGWEASTAAKYLKNKHMRLNSRLTSLWNCFLFDFCEIRNNCDSFRVSGRFVQFYILFCFH